MKQLKRNNLSNQVFEQLKEEIITKRWPPGTKIPSENELTKMLGVSRVTIRGAIQRMAILGLLEIRQGEGTFVKELTPGIYMNSLIPLFYLDSPGTMEVLEYRKVMEVGSISLAVEKRTEEDLKKLEKSLEKMKMYKHDISKFAEEDLNFHLAIAESTRNSIIIRINYIIIDLLKRSMSDIVQSLGTADGLYYHQEIITALKERDALKAQELMKEHIQRTIQRISQEMLRDVADKANEAECYCW